MVDRLWNTTSGFYNGPDQSMAGFHAGRLIAIGVYGQSNEHGSVQPSEATAFPAAFKSTKHPSSGVPHWPAVSRQGGYWSYVQDAIEDLGYSPRIVNGAIGGLGFVVQGNGRIQSWVANTSYSGKRAPSGLNGDRGDFGDIIMVGTRVWNAIVGQQRYILNASSELDVGGQRMRDFLTFGPAVQSGASQPAALNTGAVGDTVVDGGITWKCLSITGTASGPYLGALVNAVFTKSMYGYGFDPLNSQQRLHEAMQATNAGRKIIYIQNGQADLGSSAAAYGAVLQATGGNFLDLGYEVMFGLTNNSPASAANTPTNYNNLEAGRQAAITALSALYPGRVWTGPNLYALMGITGPMASGGEYMQADNVHLNAQGCVGPAISGVVPAGEHIASAFRAILPRV